MKVLKENSLLLSGIMFLFLLLREKLPYVSFVFCLYLWYRRNRLNMILPVLLCLMILAVPRTSSAVPECRSAVIREVHENYAVAVSGRYRFVVYSDQTLYYDTTVSVGDDFQKIMPVISFFGYDFARSCAGKGIFYSTSLIPEVQKTSFSIRYLMQKKIETFPDPDVQNTLNKVLLGIGSDRFRDGFLADSGIALSGVLALLNYVFRQFLYPRERKLAVMTLTAVLIIIYRAPASLLIRFLYDLSGSFTEENDEACGLCLTAVMLIKPHAYCTPSFLMPAVLRVVSCSPLKQKTRRFLYTSCLQSILFSRCVPLQMFFFPVLNRISGAMWILALYSLLSGLQSPADLIMQADRFLSYFSGLSLSGSMLGAGLPFYLILVYRQRNKDHFHEYAAVMLYLFLSAGLFHPFAEVTFINVGQGTCSLVRMPFGRENILIDTGRPSAYRYVTALLDAKGITQLQTIYVSHSDSDHSGNTERLAEKYHAGEIITAHFPGLRGRKLKVLDLNRICCEDENRSSQVICFRLNGLDFLMTGDADEAAEREVICHFPGLRTDVLNVSHHGSHTGSCGRFLDAVRPQIAVISCGDERIYHHPSEATLQKLLVRHIPFFITREDGDITVLAAGGLNLLVTASGKIAIIGS